MKVGSSGCCASRTVAWQLPIAHYDHQMAGGCLLQRDHRTAWRRYNLYAPPGPGKYNFGLLQSRSARCLSGPSSPSSPGRRAPCSSPCTIGQLSESTGLVPSSRRTATGVVNFQWHCRDPFPTPETFKGVICVTSTCRSMLWLRFVHTPAEVTWNPCRASSIWSSRSP